MTNLKKALLGAAAAMALAAPAANAALINVGGVLLDPDYSDGGEVDFISQFNFTQWYSTKKDDPTNTITTANYDAAVRIDTVLGSLDGTHTLTNYVLQGTGEFYRINELSLTNGDVFCPGCELTLGFGGIELYNDQTFKVNNAWARVYVDSTPDYTHPLSNSGEVASALDGQVWLDLKFKSLSFQSGTVDNGVVSAVFEITGGLAQNNFDPQSLQYTADAKFIDVNGNPLKYSTGGNGSAYGDTKAIPEPASLALLGIGLFGIGGMQMRRKNAKA